MQRRLKGLHYFDCDNICKIAAGHLPNLTIKLLHIRVALQPMSNSHSVICIVLLGSINLQGEGEVEGEGEGEGEREKYKRQWFDAELYNEQKHFEWVSLF